MRLVTRLRFNACSVNRTSLGLSSTSRISTNRSSVVISGGVARCASIAVIGPFLLPLIRVVQLSPKGERKRRATVQSPVCPDPPTMPLDDALYDRQADPSAL